MEVLIPSNSSLSIRDSIILGFYGCLCLIFFINSF